VHILSTRLSQRRQILVHIGLLALTVAFLPLARPEASTDATNRPITWLLMTLGSSVGLPFFALSATAPLLQRWFAIRTASDPYFLYAASNAGSFIGLLSYPFLIERALTLDAQRVVWSAVMVGVVGLIGGCGAASLRGRAPMDQDLVLRPDVANPLTDSTTWTERLRWLALAFVPSSLLLGVTLHISTDVAAVPLLWVVPLALYLLTFVFAFASRPPVSRVWTARLAPLAVLAAIAALVFSPGWTSGLAIHLGAFVIIALVCHRELADRRPAAQHLTAFYLWLSLGGALGGFFNAIVAPLMFDEVVEYPLVLALAAVVRPPPAWRKGGPESLVLVVALPLMAFAAIAAAWAGGLMPDLGAASLISAYWLCAAAALAFANRRIPFAMAVAAVILSHTLLPRQSGTRELFSDRSFFGVHRVTADTPPTAIRLFHGTTLHGWQAADARDRCEPTSYYHATGPIGQVFAALGDRVRDVAIIGLGAGSLACYGRGDTRLTFFEIDPVIEHVARDPALFTYLSRARGEVRVIIGDGRVGLTATAPETFDVVVVDAFSSDAIPVHLLTREFLEVAARRLRPGGVLAFHISNRHLDLGPVLAATATAIGLDARAQYHSPALADALASRWMLVGHPDGLLGQATASGPWRSVPAAAHGWTDDYSNILDVLTWSSTGNP
jgi:SAM-dependent methyltransferase